MNKSTFILILTSLGIDTEYALAAMTKFGIDYTFFTPVETSNFLEKFKELNSLGDSVGASYFQETSVLQKILKIFWEAWCTTDAVNDAKKRQKRDRQRAEEDKEYERRRQERAQRNSSYTAPKATVGFDPYQVLGVSPSTSKDQIKIAYRRLAAQLHPDVNHRPDAHEKMAQLNNAYAAIR